MVIYAARLRWREVSAVLTLAAAFGLCLLGGQTENPAVSAAHLARTEADQTAYLAELGWEVSGPPETDQVLLPEKFGSEFDAYLSLQQDGGFDLVQYAGETVTRYSYPISNYPTGEEGVRADLLVLDGEIIGGELRSVQLDGFMAALLPRASV
ncbi:MAG: DUF4830 domain-containing protein [Candidatus Onthomonas sp.]